MSERLPIIIAIATGIASLVYVYLLKKLETKRYQRSKSYQPTLHIKEMLIVSIVFMTLVVTFFALDIRLSPDNYPAYNDNLESLIIQDTCEEIINNGYYKDRYGLLISSVHIFTLPQKYDGYRNIYLVIRPLETGDTLWVSETYLRYLEDYREPLLFLPDGEQVEVFAIASFNKLNSDTTYQPDILNNKELIVSNVLSCTLPEYTASIPPEPYVTEFPAADALSKDKPIGDVRVIYPQRMSTKTTDVVSLTISVPVSQSLFNFYKIKVEPVDVTRVEVSPDSFGLLDYQQNKVYSGTIRVADRMKAQLDSINFTVAPRQNPIQEIYFNSNGAQTTWIWEIEAPDILGKQNFTITVWADGHENPIWRGSFEIEIVELTPVPTMTPLPTDTPLPPPETPTPTATMTPSLTPSPTLTPTQTVLQEFGTTFKKDITTILLWVLGVLGTFILSLYGVIKKHLGRKDEIIELEEKLGKEQKKLKGLILIDDRQKQIEIINDLEAKITKLKLVRWWEFWK